MSEPLHLSPTSIAQYIRLDNCERFLRFRLAPDDLKRLEKKWGLTIQPLTPLLKESGADFEKNITEKLVRRGETLVNLEGEGFEKTVEWFQNVKNPTILYQPNLEAPIGNYQFTGTADIIRLSRNRQNQLQIHIADIKATRQERTEHRVQVAVYVRMIQHMIQENQLPVSEIKGTILTQQEDGSFPILEPDSPTFELETYLLLLDRLVVLPDSVINRVTNQSFDDCFYHLTYKCDGCLYNAICMYDSAERLDVTLTPQITAVEKRVLNEVGVKTVSDLAVLMDLPPQGKYEMIPSPAHQKTLAQISGRWPVAPNLPFLVQRAKAALHYFVKTNDYRTYVFGSGFGTLPSEEQYPDLIKVFFDAQRDYLQNRVYLISGLISGPRGNQTIIECASQPPSDEIEAQLLIDWVRKVIIAINSVTRSNQAPIHLYCYNRYDQKVLLEALKRQLTKVAAIPAFYDLMTQSPALTQPMISFLVDDVQGRMNPGRMCMPLHDVARWLGFDWKDDKYEYYQLFRARLFDNRRDVIRLVNGDIKRTDENTPKDHPTRTTIEAAARFNSQIPLEYVYAAWNRLPEDKEDSRLLEPFRAVDLEALKSFAATRAKALAHIEAAFKNKSKYIEKIPLNIPSILQAEEGFDFARSLKEFLYIEHHTSLQNNLLSYNLPVERRVQSGTALLLRFSHKVGLYLYEFVPEFDSLGLEPVLTMNSCKLKENDWVVFNQTQTRLTPNQMKHGRLAVIEEISTRSIVLRLMSMTFQNGFFRYYHDNRLEPIPGLLYSIDPMSDDLNADKMIAALGNAQTNIFFEWLLHTPTNRIGSDQDHVFFDRFVDHVNALLRNRKLQLTKKQREAIADNFDKPLFLVQGPPGTGKSYTLAWAVLAKIGAAGVQGKPCRILISCKTHNAINVELNALAQAQAHIGVFAPVQIGGQVIFGTEIYKIVNDPSDPVPNGVRALDPYNQKSSLEKILAKPYLVIGATSGGAFNLMKYRDLGGKEVVWEEKTFDVVVIDEASQMSLPEGVLAGAFLKQNGQMIVVGDHRQMPPIIAHPWKEEKKRSVAETQPFISLFEALEQRQFPCVRLDESFRLHYEIAEFLRENIYSRDGIDFHSKRKELIHQLPKIDEYVDSAMDPAYPIVVIEHTEQASQQFNPLEIELVRPLIDACVNYLSLDGRTGIGVVVPHRAQKALLRSAFPSLAEVNSIDTVERFQGDERDVIIVSATASDPDYVRNEADFLLNMNRLNVAISRPRKKLIVIASRSVIDLLTSDLEIFEQSVIWKRLYHHYTPDLLLAEKINEFEIMVRGRAAVR